MLEKFLESNHKFFAHDYEVIKIDQENMLNGVALEDRLRRGRQTGLPWIVILDSDGNELSTGIGPKGNIGCPVEPHGIEHFMGMLEKTAIRTNESQRSELRTILEDFAKPYQAQLGY